MKVTENYLRKLIKEEINKHTEKGASRDEPLSISLAFLEKLKPELYRILYIAGKKATGIEDPIDVTEELRKAGLYDGDASKISVTGFDKLDGYKYFSAKTGRFINTNVGPGTVHMIFAHLDKSEFESFYDMIKSLQDEQKELIASQEGVDVNMIARGNVF
jgi:hypothetical protein